MQLNFEPPELLDDFQHDLSPDLIGKLADRFQI